MYPATAHISSVSAPSWEICLPLKVSASRDGLLENLDTWCSQQMKCYLLRTDTLFTSLIKSFGYGVLWWIFKSSEHISIQGRTQRVIVRSLCHWNPGNFYPCSDLHSQVALLPISQAVKKRCKRSKTMNDTFFWITQLRQLPVTSIHWILLLKIRSYAQMDDFINTMELMAARTFI